MNQLLPPDAPERTSSPAPQTAEVSPRVIEMISSYLDDLARRTHERLDTDGRIAGVAVTMALRGAARPVTAGASSEVTRQVDELQFELGDGPCLNALRGNGGDYVADLGADDRWGEYGPRAAAMGARSCQSVPVLSGAEVVAVTKVYSSEVDGLSLEQRRIGEQFALEVSGGIGLAQTLVHTAQDLDDRVQAMDRRHLIDLAVGRLMERTGTDADTAFALLRQESQNRNVKLRDVATAVVGVSAEDLEPAPFTSRTTTEVDPAAPSTHVGG